MRMSRRGMFLVIIGIIQLVIGWATLIAPAPSLTSLHMAHAIGPVALGAVMLTAGVGVIVNAFWPPGRDRLGFMIAFPVPLFWGLDTMITTVMGQWPVGGYTGGLRSVVFWWGYAALILLVSGMVGIEEYRYGERSDSDCHRRWRHNGGADVPGSPVQLPEVE